MVTLHLHITFIEAFQKLPKRIQNKVKTFAKKFMDNPKSSAIHLEPIISFKDTSLQSARIDQTYRAIIKTPKSGTSYFMMWVDHHDKAYRWAENKEFIWNDEVETLQMFSKKDIKEIQDTSNERNSNKLYDNFKDKDLIKIGVPKPLLPAIRSIIDLNGLEDIEPYISNDIFENLFSLADGVSIDSLIFEINEGKTNEAGLDKQVNSPNNRRNFIQLTDDSIFNEAISGTLNNWKYYLHPTQRKIVDSDFSGSVKVTGAAGTGKTVAALHRLKKLAKIKTVFLTTYTKSLTSNLKRLAKTLDVNLSNVTIENIDSFAIDLATKKKVISDSVKIIEFTKEFDSLKTWENILLSDLNGWSANFLSKEYEFVVLQQNVKSIESYRTLSRLGRGEPLTGRQRKKIWNLFNKYESIKLEKGFIHRYEAYNLLTNILKENNEYIFDSCIVDELQDFSNVELRLIRAMVPEGKNDLFLAGDPMQNLYNKKFVFSKLGINIRGRKSYRLKVNYRTTEEIKKLAVSVIKDCKYDDFNGEEEKRNGYVSLLHGLEPQYKIFKTKAEEVDFVISSINQLIDEGVEYNEICIGCREKKTINFIKTELHERDIPYYTQASDLWTGNTKGIRILTLHSMKGLEFKHVFLFDINNKSCPKKPYSFKNWTLEEQKAYLKKERSLYYVAISRAIQYVTMTGTGAKSNFIEI